MAQAPCGCPHAWEECSRGGRGGGGLCVLRGAPAMCHVRSEEDSGRGWLSHFLKVPMWEQAHHALGQLYESCTLSTRFIIGRQWITCHTGAGTHLPAERRHAAGGVGHCQGPWTCCGGRLASGPLPGRGSLSLPAWLRLLLLSQPLCRSDSATPSPLWDGVCY